MFRLLGFLIGLISLIVMLVAFLPLLGWLNWINIPLATIGLIFSSIGGTSGGKTMNGVAVVVGAVRLVWGGGVI